MQIQQLQDQRKWVRFSSHRLAPTAGTWAEGMVCEATASLPNGVYRHRFWVTDEEGVPAVGSPSLWTLGPRLTGPPELWTTGLRGRDADFVYPDAGAAADTLFRFAVQYSDGDGTPPFARRIDIQKQRPDGTWRGFTSTVLAAWGGTPRGGKFYSFTRKLPAGVYRHRFFFANSKGRASGAASQYADASAWQPGPVVEAAASTTAARASRKALLSTVVLAPANTTVPITFTLAAASDVGVRVLNMAGRPVRALPYRATEAGTTTITWDRRSDRGLRVPAGAYLLEVTARARDGSRSRAIVPVRLSG